MLIRKFFFMLVTVFLLTLSSALALLVIGSDSTPLPERETLIAELASLPDDQNAFPLWQQIFTEQSHTVDAGIIQIARQKLPWDGDQVERQISQSTDLFPLVRELRRFDSMRSDYVTSPLSYSYSEVPRLASVIISAGQWRWQEGQHAEATELFLDATHIINLLYRDEGMTLVSVAVAQHALRSLVSTLQRLIANAENTEELEYLAAITIRVPLSRHAVLLKAFQNERIFSRLILLEHINTPFTTRLSEAIESYQWWQEQCSTPSTGDELFCKNRAYNALTLVLPRFYTHWNTASSYLDQHARNLHVLAMSCLSTTDSSTTTTPSPHWSDYVTPDSAMARYPTGEQLYRRIIINHCLTDFFVNSLQIALTLKEYELTHEQWATSLDEVFYEVPRDPFSLTPIRYDMEHQLLWSAGVEGSASRGYPYAPPPSAYTADSILSAHPTYLLRPRPITDPEKRSGLCEQDESIPPLGDTESQ